MRQDIATLCATAVCLTLLSVGVASAQPTPEVTEKTAEQTKDALLMRNAATAYLAEGDLVNGRRAYLPAWDIARYWAIYSPNKWSTVAGIGGSGTRRLRGIRDMRSMVDDGVPALLMTDTDFANTMNGFLAELETLERQGTADNPRIVLGGLVSNLDRPENARIEMIGLWERPNGVLLRIKQVGTQVSVAGGGAFIGVGKPEDIASGTFDGSKLRFSAVDELGNRIDCAFTYSEEPASATANFNNSVLRGTVTLTVGGASTVLPQLRLLRTYNSKGGPLRFNAGL